MSHSSGPLATPGSHRKGTGGGSGGGGSYSAHRPLAIPVRVLKIIDHDPEEVTKYADLPKSYTGAGYRKVACAECAEPRIERFLDETGRCRNRKACASISRERARME